VQAGWVGVEDWGSPTMLVTIVIRILETMFALGIIGSAVVVILTAIEDFKMLFKKDKEP
jgi:purine-cytosine permease-like protein